MVVELLEKLSDGNDAEKLEAELTEKREAAEEKRELDQKESDLLEKLLLPANLTKINKEVETEDSEVDEKNDLENELENDVLEIEAQVQKRAWQDEDDLDETKKLQNNRLGKSFTKGHEEKVFKGEEYQQRLDEVFANSYKQPSWLSAKKQKLGDDSSEDETGGDSSLTISAKRYLKKSGVSSRISISHLDVRKCEKEVSLQSNSARFKAFRFHPDKPLLANIGHKQKHVQLTKIDGVDNSILDYVKFDTKDKLVDVCFGADNRMFALTNFVNKRAHNNWQCNIFERDLTSGKNIHHKNIRGLDTLAARRFTPSPDGQQAVLYNNQPSAQISILSLRNSNLQVICNKRQSSKIIDAVAFRTQVHDFGLATLAQDGEVFLWDVRNMLKCVQTIKSQGVVRASRLAVNPHNGKQLAVAGHTGYVSLYEFQNSCLSDDFADGNPSPVKEFNNLTTCVNSLSFGGPNGELLAFSSAGNWADDEEERAAYIKQSNASFGKNSDAGLVKIAHVGSKQVYSQFPNQVRERAELGTIQACCFSPNGKYLLFQNTKGKLPLYTLGHNFKY